MNAKQKQLEAIKNGKAMTTRTYSGRLQPFGPQAPLPTRNAVNLSTVPSSASEKFNGGREKKVEE